MRLLSSGKPKPALQTCSPFSFVGALALILITFTCTRVLDETYRPCDRHTQSKWKEVDRPSGKYRHYGTFEDVFGQTSWPNQGYGAQLQLRIYVYEDREIFGLKELMSGRDRRIDLNSCVKGQWGTQVKIHRFLLQSKFRTFSTDEAQLFFVPSYVKCVRINGGLNDKEINHTFVKILQQMPYFRRSSGRDHVFVFPSGAGAHLFKGWDVYLNRSIFLTPEGDRTDKRGTSAFNTWKDIIIPGNIDDTVSVMVSDSDKLVQPIPLVQRKFIANFLGRAQGKAGRLQLLELAQRFPNELEAPNLAFSGPMKLGRREYFQHLGNARFCLAPRGESSWTLRLYESLFVMGKSKGCWLEGE